MVLLVVLGRLGWFRVLVTTVLLSRNEFQFIFQFVNPKAQFIKGTMTSLNAAYDVTVAWSVLDHLYSTEQYHPQEGGDLVKLVELSKTTKPVSYIHM